MTQEHQRTAMDMGQTPEMIEHNGILYFSADDDTHGENYGKAMGP